MLIRRAALEDGKTILLHDRWISKETLRAKILDGQVYAAFNGDQFIGWLRYSLFWDNTPFMNMLRILESYRGNGIGKALVEHWERDMRQLGYQLVLTSTAQTETAQHFYEKLGYKAVGGFTLASQPFEIIFAKAIVAF